MTKASDVTAQLVARLTGITRVGGYNTDIGLNVARGVPASMPDELPFTCIFAVSDADSGGNRVHRKHTRNYVVETVFPAGDSYDEMQDAVLYDIRLALSDPDGKVLDGTAHKVAIGTAELDDPEIGSGLAVVRIPVAVDYTETYQRGI